MVLAGPLHQEYLFFARRPLRLQVPKLWWAILETVAAGHVGRVGFGKYRQHFGDP